MNNGEPMAKSDPSIQAVVTDDELNVAAAIWKRSKLDLLVQNVELLLDLAQA